MIECPALLDLRNRYESLFQAPREVVVDQGDAMIVFTACSMLRKATALLGRQRLGKRSATSLLSAGLLV